MKTQTMFFAAFFLMMNVNFATIRTVSNHSPNPGQFTTIQAAINAATAGDTIYVHPSPTNYTAFTLDRRLTLIGNGFAPSTINPNPYAMTSSLCSVNNVNASFSRFIGLWFNDGGLSFTASGIHDITINRCRFDICAISFSTSMYNVTVAENQFFEAGFNYNLAIGTAHDFLISNNVFRHSYSCCSADFPFYYWNNVPNTNVINNLFYSGGAFGGDNNRIATNSSFIIFSNNIFNRVDFAGLGGCTFSNCLTFGCNTNTPWVINGTDLGNVLLGTQNVANTSPNFVNQTNIDAGGWGGVYWFIMNAGSPAFSSMPGDPDMGPYYGGSYDFRKASASTLPFVYSIVVSNPSIQAGTNLNIDVIGKKHD